MNAVCLLRGVVCRSSVQLAALAVVLALTSPSLIGVYMQTGPDPVFDAPGFQRNRQHQLPLDFERFDSLSGSLILTFVDLALPGNAGMHLEVRRTYNSKEGWSFGISGIPLTIVDPDAWSAPSPVKRFPTFRMPDGQFQPFRPTEPTGSPQMFSGPDEYINADFWVYNRTNHTLRAPDGRTLEYAVVQGTGYVQEVTDSFGNWVTFDWGSGPNGQTLNHIHQGFYLPNEPDQPYRTITFTGGTPAGGIPNTMQFDGKTWTYTRVAPGLGLDVAQPDGSHWVFNNDDGFLVTTPSGGRVRYRFDSHEFPHDRNGDPAPVVTTVLRSREVLSGRDLAPGTWTYDYSLVDGHETTTVTDPHGTQTVYRHFFGGPRDPNDDYPPLDSWWGVASREVKNSQGNTLELEAIDYQLLPVGTTTFVDDVNVVKKTILTRGTSTFTVEHFFAATNFGDFHQPNRTDETGNTTRRTERSFDYSFVPYIKAKVSSESVESPFDSTPFVITRSFDDNTGFLDSETRYGITTTYHRDGAGNVGLVRDAHGPAHDTTMTYEWGRLKDTSTPEYSITRTINHDGTVASQTRNGSTTTFGYDALGRLKTETPALGHSTAQPTRSTASPSHAHVGR